MKQGDLNTKFFHTSVKWRRAKNELHEVLENGQWCENKDEVKKKVREFFEARFVRNEELSIKLDNVRFKSTFGEDNQMLVDVFSEKEIREAVWSCDSSKSPGLNGFNIGFIKFCWDFIKMDIMAAVKDFEVNGKWPRGSNVYFLCLIPKVENPQQFAEFRPISPVGCLYKIISKALSLRLKKVISKVIDFKQSAFLKGRGLLDSMLVANEVLNEVKRKKKMGIFLRWILKRH